MRLLLSQARVFRQGGFVVSDIVIENGLIQSASPAMDTSRFDRVIDLSTGYLFPGFVDVHVHLREPGFSYKETIRSGSRAAARGGFTDVCAMPNLNPAPDCPEHVRAQQDIIDRNAAIHVYPYGTITIGQKGEGELVDMAALRGRVIALSDDGRGVQDEALMRQAMLRAKAAGLLIAAHCEDERELVRGGAVHDGVAAKKYGVAGINSRSEWAMVQRDLRLAKETGCRYHVCHISTKESVALIRAAKKDGVDVTCETAPHYLILTDEDLLDEGRFKMNPPIRTAEDRAALIEGLLDGTIDMIATDHAPHSTEEKGKGLSASAMGIVGIETSFALMYTHFVKTGLIDLPKLIDLMAIAPRRRFGIIGGEIATGQPANLTAIDLNAEWVIDPSQFLSMGRATPLMGANVRGRTLLTLVDGRIAYEDFVPEGGRE